MNVFSPHPEFDGKAEIFASFRQEVELRMLVTHLPLNRRAPALALAMDKMPRELCLALGVDVLKSDVGVGEITESLQQHIAPDASDAAYSDIILLLGLPRPHLTLDEYLPRFQMARRRAEARLPNGGIFPGIFVLVAPTKCGPRAQSGVYGHGGRRRPSVTGSDEASYASDPAVMWNGDETRCPPGEGRFAEGASDLVQA